MSTSQAPLIHCYIMATANTTMHNITTGDEGNGTWVIGGNQTVFAAGPSSPDYLCHYQDLRQRALQLVKQPHSAIALILGFTGIIINVLCLLAVHFQMRGRFTAHFRFIVSLAMSDILIAVSVVSHFINRVLNPTVYPGYGPPDVRLISRCAYIVIKALNTTALNISLLNLTGMAFDHFCAIIFPLSSHRIMSKRNSTAMIIIFWIIAFVCGYSDLFSVIPDREHLATYNFCELAFLTPYQEEFTVFAVAFLCLVSMLVIYVKIYIKIQERQRKAINVRDDHRTHLSDSMKQTKKALVTTLIILGTFISCWLPLCLFQVTLIIQVMVNPEVINKWIRYLGIADKYLYDLMLLNAIMDPIIYAIRMPEVRCGYRKMCWRFSRCFKRDRLLMYNNSGTSYVSMLEKKSSLKLSKKNSSSRSIPPQAANMKMDYPCNGSVNSASAKTKKEITKV